MLSIYLTVTALTRGTDTLALRLCVKVCPLSISPHLLPGPPAVREEAVSAAIEKVAADGQGRERKQRCLRLSL